LTGGIKSANLPHLLHAAPSLAGVAIISEIVGARNPKPVCENLQGIIKSFTDRKTRPETIARTPENIASGLAELLKVLRKEGPVINVRAIITILSTTRTAVERL
jgi:hypothetical protein